MSAIVDRLRKQLDIATDLHSVVVTARPDDVRALLAVVGAASDYRESEVRWLRTAAVPIAEDDLAATEALCEAVVDAMTQRARLDMALAALTPGASR